MIVGRKVLEHDPEKVCENKNIHADHKEHLVYREDNNGTTKYTIYEEKENIALFTIIRTDRNMLLACYSHKHISYRIRTIIRKAINLLKKHMNI
ncbi:hypothetical protein OZD68_04655 [Wolbachia endosymbiont of Drosophila bicornuta]|uniref:hypothetical protein n=1 Tax=Wolbachia TaxID=953 RepID=UPI001C716455|nr:MULTISPECIES: hypothetical protein [Wolbachia]MBA8755553.1 hypothetical protein [Wolbachia pipientis]MDE5056860.1 hypothetical protein [Wolbachia endosymbiont of Drosophila bicornuta]